MPRLPRVQVKGALYYVTCRGEHQEKIFKDEGDYQMFLGLLKRQKEQYGFKLFAYALLPDHLHLLMELSDAGISEIMHGVNSNYTKYYNNKYQRKGHLFRERFKAALVEKEPYLPKIIAYIHLNPQKVNLSTNPQDYPYSSYCFYLDKGKAQAIDMAQEIEEALGYMKDAPYQDFIKLISNEEAQGLHKRLHRGGIVGSTDFVERVKDEISRIKKEQQEQEQPQARKPLSLAHGAGILALGILLVGGGVVYFLNIPASRIQESQKKDEVESEAIRSLQDLNMTEWQVQLTPFTGGEKVLDTLTFNEGKFISAKLYSIFYPPSNYSVAIEESGKVTWETMQTGPDGTASWRAEIDNGSMHGMLSLRQKDKEPQDFSFISQGYRRRLK